MGSSCHTKVMHARQARTSIRNLDVGLTPFRISKRTGLQWGNREPFLQLVTLEKARTVREDNVDMQVVQLTGCDKSGGSW